MSKETKALKTANTLRGQIEQGVYEAGQKLPNENDLSAQMGISRTTLREAIRILVSEGSSPASLLSYGSGCGSGAGASGAAGSSAGSAGSSAGNPAAAAFAAAAAFQSSCANSSEKPVDSAR